MRTALFFLTIAFAAISNADCGYTIDQATGQYVYTCGSASGTSGNGCGYDIDQTTGQYVYVCN